MSTLQASKKSNSGFVWGVIFLLLLGALGLYTGIIKNPVVVAPDGGVKVQFVPVEIPGLGSQQPASAVVNCKASDSVATVSLNTDGTLNGQCLSAVGRVERVYLDPALAQQLRAGTADQTDITRGVANAVFEVLVSDKPAFLGLSPDKESAREAYVTAALAFSMGQDEKGTYMQMPNIDVLLNVPKQVVAADWSVFAPVPNSNGTVSFTPLTQAEVDVAKVKIPKVEFVKLGDSGVQVRVQPQQSAATSSTGQISQPPSQGFNSASVTTEPSIIGYKSPMLEALIGSQKQESSSAPPSAGWNKP